MTKKVALFFLPHKNDPVIEESAALHWGTQLGLHG